MSKRNVVNGTSTYTDWLQSGAIAMIDVRIGDQAPAGVVFVEADDYGQGSVRVVNTVGGNTLDASVDPVGLFQEVGPAALIQGF